MTIRALPTPPLSQRIARVRRRREWPWVVVERRREDGALDWFTWHLTRRGARNAAELYLRDGTVRGIRP
jgi:hypothetical protein